MSVEAIIVVVICLISAALASGLTQGLLSLDVMEMKIKLISGTEQEKKYAKALLPLITRHHLLLVSLMLWNATAMETLPIFLDELVPTFVAIILSVTLLLFVGEIIPASIMTGPNQLELAASLAPVVYVVLMVFLPVAYPIAVALDYVLGHEEGMTTYNRAELSTMVRLQHEESLKRKNGYEIQGENGGVNADEITMIDGVLKFREMVVETVMTKREEIFMLSLDDKLNLTTLNKIFRMGYSRIPICEGEATSENPEIVGLILAKDLLFVDPEDGLPLRSFFSLFSRPITFVDKNQKLAETLRIFRQSRSHLAVVSDVIQPEDLTLDPVRRNVGIITLEDIIEKILGKDIEDETDEIEGHNRDRDRDIDLARQRILNPHLLECEKHLSSDEVLAVATHLHANVPQVSRLAGESMAEVKALVAASLVVEHKRVAKDDRSLESEDSLYKKGKPSNSCILILAGKVVVLAGKDAFRVELGPWATLGQDALGMDSDTYIPDFSCFVVSADCKYLRISRVSAGAVGAPNKLSRALSHHVPPRHVGGQLKTQPPAAAVTKGGADDGRRRSNSNSSPVDERAQFVDPIPTFGSGRPRAATTSTPRLPLVVSPDTPRPLQVCDNAPPSEVELLPIASESIAIVISPP